MCIYFRKKSHVILFYIFLNREYIENIGIVDAGVKATVQLFDEFYNHDNRTSFVFTADHGMTHWGKYYNFFNECFGFGKINLRYIESYTNKE